jgi:hypothetical protein
LPEKVVLQMDQFDGSGPTVRLPRAGYRPGAKSGSGRAGANVKMIAAKRPGRSGIAVSLGGGTPAYSIVRFAAPALPQQPSEMAESS